MANKLASWKITLDNFGASRDVTVDAIGYNSSGTLLEFFDAQSVVLAVPESSVLMIERVDAAVVQHTPDPGQPLHKFATAMNEVFTRDQERHPIRQQPRQ